MAYSSNRKIHHKYKFILFLSTILLCFSLILAGCSNSLDSFSELTFNGGILYYSSTVSKIEAENLKKYLDEEEIFASSDSDIFLDKNENAYVISFILIDNDSEPDDETIYAFKLFIGEVSYNVFNSAKVDLNLCDDELNILYTIPNNEAILLMKFNGGDLFYNSTVSLTEVEAVGSYLVEIEYFDGEECEVFLLKDENTYELGFVVDEGIVQDEEAIRILDDIRKELSEFAFNSNKVSIILLDEDLNTLKEIK